MTVHQVVRDLDGELINDSTVHHVYRLRGDRVEHMEIREALLQTTGSARDP